MNKKEPAKKGKILILPGDHIGPEVVKEALKVLDLFETENDCKFERDFDLIGGASIKEHGVPITEAVLDKAAKADAILCGPIGGPEWDVCDPAPEHAFRQLAQHLQLVASYKCGIVSDNLGGAYFGKKIEKENYSGDAWGYSKPEIERVARVAAGIALQNQGQGVSSIDKSDVLVSSRLWRKVVDEVFTFEFPTLSVEHLLADKATGLMITDPARLRYRTILTDSALGDLLCNVKVAADKERSTLNAVVWLAGPPGGEDGQNSAGGVRGLYMPMHDSAPELTGKKAANPVAMIYCIAEMFQYSFGMSAEASYLKQCIDMALSETDFAGYTLRTVDLGGDASTSKMGAAIRKEVNRHWWEMSE